MCQPCWLKIAKFQKHCTFLSYSNSNRLLWWDVNTCTGPVPLKFETPVLNYNETECECKKKEISFAVLIRNVDIGQKPKSWECKIPYIFFSFPNWHIFPLEVFAIFPTSCETNFENYILSLQPSRGQPFILCFFPPSAITVGPVCHSQISLWQTGSDCLIQIHNRDSRHTFSEPPN